MSWTLMFSVRVSWSSAGGAVDGREVLDGIKLKRTKIDSIRPDMSSIDSITGHNERTHQA
jgi:hypothetical protein